VSLGRLALLLVTATQQVEFLQKQDILPTVGTCHQCQGLIHSDYKVKGTKRYWICKDCKLTTSIRYGTVLYNSNMQLNRFVMMIYCFTERNKTYAQTINECCLPSEDYRDCSMSPSSVNKWFTYLRSLCCKDWYENLSKLGGEGFVIEMDESLFGKLKYGRGDPTKRRRAWVFGMVCRKTGRVILWVCPRGQDGKFKRTKAALWPIIQANVLQGTTLYTDGFRGYRKLPTLGYPHKWVDHSKEYVSSEDPDVHTNRIEGVWGTVKRWLPSSGPYNLEEYLQMFQWFEMQKLAGVNPFWRLMELVAKDNSVDSLKEASKNQKKSDSEGEPINELLEATQREELEESEDESDDEEMFWFDCPFCKMIFDCEKSRKKHMQKCQ
jgi:transposase-like protein